MDNTVKNAYDRLTAGCDAVQKEVNQNADTSVRELLARDVRAFILRISLTGAEVRYDDFNKAYQGGKYPIKRVTFPDDHSCPECFALLKKYDEKMAANSPVSLTGLYLSFFHELGRYYIFSHTDRKEIDPRQYIAYVTELGGQLPVVPPKNMKKETGDSHEKSSVSAAKKPAREKAESGAPEKTPENTEEPEKTLEELMEELNALTGLSGVKAEVNTLINMLTIKKIREERGLKTANTSKHLVFLGNPGTGKTTVARLLSKIYRRIGVLEKGQLIEVDRSELVAGYVGQTALKTKEKIDEAIGGILFIDEAYTLAKGGNDFGQEAIDTILKAMEDKRDNLVVIVAGYSKPMEDFLNSNPGLRSRFNKNIVFEDYSESELFSIFMNFCKTYDMKLSIQAENTLKCYLAWLVNNKPANFANGREMRNLFETALSNQANRLAKAVELTDEKLNEIEKEDLPFYVTASVQKEAEEHGF